MLLNIFLQLLALKAVDKIFFISCAAVIAVGVGVYFLWPLIFSKKFKQQRADLKKREEAFKNNLTKTEETKDSE